MTYITKNFKGHKKIPTYVLTDTTCARKSNTPSQFLINAHDKLQLQ
jgi:hypothetical protein